jgi:DNA-binding response OmpR family regulator
MPANILLIDEDQSRRESVQLILKSSDYLVVVATDCRDALTVLAGRQFDLILLDITLPDRSGFGVLEFLENNHIATKVMVITGTTTLANVMRSATPGARDYVTKPISPTDLLKSIAHILSERSQPNVRLQIVRAGEFINSTPTGDLDMKASKEGLAQIAAAGTDLRDYKVLIDLRDVNSKLSTADIYELAYELADYGETFRRKTAVLARPDEDLDQAKFFEDAAQNRGFKVKTFTVFEDAVLWLSSITQLTEDK